MNKLKSFPKNSGAFTFHLGCSAEPLSLSSKKNVILPIIITSYQNVLFYQLSQVNKMHYFTV